MSFAGYFIVLVIIVGAIVGMFAVAANSQQMPVGTYGDAPTIQTNNTAGVINQTYVPIAGLGIGVLFIVMLLIIFGAAGIIMKAGRVDSGRR